MGETFEIFKTMVASTAHIEEQDLEALRVFSDFFIVQEDDYGSAILISDEDSLKHISQLRVSEGLKLLVLFAASNGCRWLRLDADGPLYDNLPVYDW